MNISSILVFLCVVVAVQGVTVTPMQIPFSDPEITNANRGFFTSYGQSAVTLPKAPYFEYWRFSWNNVEKALNTYDFTGFDNQAKKCCNRAGCSFGFRFMAAQPEYYTVLPTYLNNAMAKAYYVNNSYAHTLVPDWNDPYFLQRSWALLNATAKHIRDANLTCVRHSDIGLYGWWGEAHMTSVTYPLPNGAQAATNATLRAFVDMHMAALPGMQLYALSGNFVMSLYAFSKSDKVGMRRDSLGNPEFDRWKTQPGWDVFQNRWKTAPFIVEVYGNYPSRTNISVALRQVKEYHVSSVANAGLPTNMPLVEQQTWMNAGKSAGFRLTIERATITEPVGKSLNVNVTWNNHGIAPIYATWNVMYSLVFNNTLVVAQWKSNMDLRTVQSERPVSFAEKFNVSTVKAGQYSLSVQIVDPLKRDVPLALAIKGGSADSRYTLAYFYVNPTLPANLEGEIPVTVDSSSPISDALQPESELMSIGQISTGSALVSIGLVIMALF